MSIWKGGLWGSQRFPNGNGIWKGGLWQSQRRITELRALLADLFGEGQQGLLFVPEPGLEGKDVLYQDEAGTTLADANGDPVGLGLEFSQGLELGPELVDSLNSAGEWSPYGNNTVVQSGSDEITITYVDDSNGAITYLRESDGLSEDLIIGRFYEITFDARTSSGTANIQVAASPNQFIGLDSSTKTFTRIFSATSPTLNYIRSTAMSAGQDVVISNISVKEIPGNHLTQPTSADRPTYNTDGTLHWLKGDGAGDIISADVQARDVSAEPTVISAAVRFDDTTGFKYPVGVGNTADTNSWAGFRYDSAGFRVTAVDDSGTAVVLSGPQEDLLFHVFTLEFDGAGGIAFYVDGVLHDSATIAATTINSLSLHGLRRSITGSFANSSIAGAVMHTNISKRVEVEDYLASLAGITL